jgi:hypothetical protein
LVKENSAPSHLKYPAIIALTLVVGLHIAITQWQPKDSSLDNQGFVVVIFRQPGLLMLSALLH